MSEPQTPPPAADPKSDADKGKDKGLDKFIKDAKPPVTPPITPPVEPPADDDKDFKEEFDKLQKKQYNIERRQALTELLALNPEVAEQYKSSKLSEIETALKVTKTVAPKFPVNREAPVEETKPRQGYLNRRTGKWE